MAILHFATPVGVRFVITSLCAAFLCILVGCGERREVGGAPGTLGDTTAPMVTGVTPACGSTSAALNSVVTVTFSEALRPSTVNANTVTLTGPGGPVAGAISYDPSSHSVAITPSSNLLPGTTYTITVTVGITDLNGNALASQFSCGFTTTGPPIVISTNPMCGATTVALNGAISANFNTDLLSSSVNTATVTLTGAGAIGLVAGSITYDTASRSVIFVPLGALVPSSTYTLRITTGVQASGGLSLPSNFVCTFATGLLPDTTPPTITVTVPSCGATAVALNSAVALSFSEAMDPRTVNQSAITLSAGSTVVTGVVTYNAASNIAVFLPALPLSANTTYTITAGTGLKDLAGNSLAATFSCTFTTGTGPDITLPTIISTNPSCGAVGISLNAAVNITFSEAMDPASINAVNITLFGAGAVGLINSTVSLNSAGDIATVIPVSKLTPSTVYIVTVAAAVKDLAGNPLGTSFVCSFTTGANLNLMAPNLNTASNFEVLAGISVLNAPNPGTLISGNVGVSPGTLVTGLTSGTVNGTIHLNDTATVQAQTDLTAAYNNLAARPCGSGNDFTGMDLGGKTLFSGVFCFSGGAAITTSNLTLDAQGDTTAVFIIQIPGTLVTVGTPQVILANGARAANVFWQVGGSAFVSAGTLLQGNVLCLNSINLGVGATANGRLLSRTATVSLISDVVSLPSN